jgi:hypothetical protein
MPFESFIDYSFRVSKSLAFRVVETTEIDRANDERCEIVIPIGKGIVKWVSIWFYYYERKLLILHFFNFPYSKPSMR